MYAIREDACDKFQAVLRSWQQGFYMGERVNYRKAIDQNPKYSSRDHLQ